jgi:hypothetical protein
VQLEVGPVPASVHIEAVVLPKLGTTGRLTLPVGVVAPLVDVSVTVAVHDIGSLMITVVGVHPTVIVVGCRFATVNWAVVELVA